MTSSRYIYIAYLVASVYSLLLLYNFIHEPFPTNIVEPIGVNHLNDTYMDFYNTNSNANREDKYTSWASLYPPLNFIIASIFNNGCEHVEFNGLNLRNCDTWGIYILFSLHLIGCLLVSISLCKALQFNKINIIALSFILLMTLPSVFLLERANYIIIVFLLLAIMVNVKKNTLRIILSAIMINLKPYLVLPLYNYYSCMKIRDRILFILLSAFILSSSYIILYDLEAWRFIVNSFSFASANVSSFEKLWFPTSVLSQIKALSKYLDNNLIFNVNQIFVLNLLQITYISFALAALYYLFKVIINIDDPNIQLLSGISFLLILLDSIGGYGLVLLMPFFPIYLKYGDKFVIISLIILFFPLDFSIEYGRFYQGKVYGYDDMDHIMYRSLTFISLIRPLLVAALFIRFSKLIIHENKS